MLAIGWHLFVVLLSQEDEEMQSPIMIHRHLGIIFKELATQADESSTNVQVAICSCEERPYNLQKEPTI